MDLLDKINKEKELIGMYLTAHPLDQFKADNRQSLQYRPVHTQ